MALKTYKGSCHCGKVRYEADLDLSAGTGKCNCSVCTKIRRWGAQVKPDAFRLLSDPNDLGDYGFASNIQRHLFCKHCGVHTFGKGNVPQIGGEYYSISLATLDNLDPSELAGAPVRYFNGRDNDWFSTPQETRHL
jgi:hypothetical protein